MQCGALRHGGLDGTGRKMDEVSSTFTSAAPLNADSVLIQEYHTVHTLLTHTIIQSSVISTERQIWRAIFSDTNSCRFFHLDLLPAYVNWQRHSCSIFKISQSLSIQSVMKSVFSFSINTHLDHCHRQSHARQRLLWSNLVSGKEQPSPQKPSSIPIKLHCYAFNKGSLRTTVILWLFSSCAKSAHSIFYAIWTIAPNRVGLGCLRVHIHA